MLKKFLSWTLAVILVFSCTAFASAPSGTNGVNYVIEDFDDGSITDANSAYWETQVSGTCNFTVEDAPLTGDADNKAIYFNNPASSNGKKTNLLVDTLNVTGDLYIEFDVCINSCAADITFGEFFIDGVGSASVLRFNISNGTPGTMQTYYRGTSSNGRTKLFDSWTLGKWYNFKFLIKPRANTFDIWVDNKLVKDDLNFPLDFSNSKIGNYALTVFRCQFLQAGELLLDNITMRTYPGVTLASASPSDPSAPIHPSDKLTVELDGLEDYLTLSDVQINSSAALAGSVTSDGGTFIVTPTRLAWDTEYTLTAKAKDIFGTVCNISIPFKTKALPERAVDVLGFEKSDGTKLSSLEAGLIKAKLIYEAPSYGSSYVAIAGLYKETDGVVELIDVVTVTNTNADIYNEITLPVNVPADHENMFINVFMWDSLSARNLFDEGAYFGKMKLE